jgi:UDP-3-O-[3-hydroxymyristoyl] glucosamine N-acyltransferase
MIRRLWTRAREQAAAAAVRTLGAFMPERERTQRWPILSQSLSVVPTAFGFELRRQAARLLCGGCGEGSYLHTGVVIEDPRTSIGSDVWVSTHVYIDLARIEDHVLIGPHAVLLAGRHHHRTDNLSRPIKLQGNPAKLPIVVGEGAWIGANATVMADVGAHAIVGAGAVVVDPVPAYAIVVGNPAHVVRDRRRLHSTKAAGETP